MVDWNRVMALGAIGLFTSASFTIGYELFTQDDEFKLWELVTCIIFSALWMWLPAGTIAWVVPRESDAFAAYGLWLVAVIFSISVGISDGSNFLLMIAIPTGIVVMIAVLYELWRHWRNG